jgi:hypothetical protein
MAPRFHTGDLAIVRKATRYGVGDVVAYRSSVLDTTVLHRIVAVTDGRFDTKGDNNSSIDPDHPSTSDITGKLWVRVPHGAQVLDPATAWALPAGAAAVLLVGRKRPRSSRKPTKLVDHTPAPQRDSARTWRATTLTFCAIALGSAALAALAFSQPTLATVAEQSRYVHTGAFHYAAPVPSDAVYEQSALQTGDTVFLAVAHALNVTFDYRLDGVTPASVSGDIALSATITGSNGWQRSIELAPPREFTGEQVSVVATLDLVALRALITRAELITGSRGSYTVTVTPQVHTRASLSRQPVEDDFAPTLTFDFDAIQLRIAGSNAFTTERDAKLQPKQERTVELLSTRHAHLGVHGLNAPITVLRPIALLVALTSIGATAACVYVGSRRLGAEGARISLRHGHRLIEIRTMTRTMQCVIDVTGINDLVRLADTHGSSILHQTYSGRQVYWCEAAGKLYRYRESARTHGRAAAADE